MRDSRPPNLLHALCLLACLRAEILKMPKRTAQGWFEADSVGAEDALESKRTKGARDSNDNKALLLVQLPPSRGRRGSCAWLTKICAGTS